MSIFTPLYTCIMEQENKGVSREKFLAWGAAIASVLAIPAFLRPSKKKVEKKTAKMLTQDGRLVEIDIDKIPQTRKKIRKSEIPAWVKQKPSL
jgi:hypothetical protein